MAAEDKGKITNLPSVPGLRPAPGMGIYGASKAARLMLTHLLAQALGASNIQVNAIAPGEIKMQSNQFLWQIPQFAEPTLNSLPLNGLEEPEDVAGIALFMAPSESDYVTDFIFPVDGGMTVPRPMARTPGSQPILRCRGGVPEPPPTALGISLVLQYNTPGPSALLPRRQDSKGERTVGTPSIDSYRFGQVIIDGQPHSKDVIILPDRVIANWWRKEGHSLLASDLDEVLAASPDLLVVGQGAYGRMGVTAEAQHALERAGIELVAQPTKQACETYNQRRGQKSVAAALHLTC